MSYTPDGWDFGAGPARPSDRPELELNPFDAPGAFSAAGSPAPAGNAPLNDAWNLGPGDRAAASGIAHSAPVGLLLLACICALTSLVIGFLFAPSGIPGAVTGWVLGGFCAIGCITAFTLQDGRRRTDPWYLERPLGRPLRVAAIVAAAAGVAVNAWFFADQLSRVPSL